MTDASINKPLDSRNDSEIIIETKTGLPVDSEDENSGGAGMIMNGLTVANTIMGAGTLTIPLAMKTYGIPLTIAILAGILVMTYFSVYLLLKVYQATGHTKYSHFAIACNGTAGKVVVECFIILNNLGVSCAYLIIYGTGMPNIVKEATSDSFITNRVVLIIIFAILFYPLSFAKKISALKYASFLGVSSFLIFTVIVIERAFRRFDDGHEPSSQEVVDAHYSLEVFTVIPSLFLAFTFQFNVFPIYRSLNKASVKRMMGTVGIGTSVCLVIYLLVGIFGFMIFLQDTKANILKNFDDLFNKKDGDIILLNISFVIAAVMGFPMLFFEFRNNSRSLFGTIYIAMNPTRRFSSIVSGSSVGSRGSIEEDPKGGKGRTIFGYKLAYLIHTTCVYVFCVFLAIVVPKLGIVFAFVGALGANSIAYIFPAYFYLKLTPGTMKEDKYKLPAAIMFVMGIVFAVVSVTAEIIQLAE
eukprot:CAMPEP_0114977356 /NCGR_PEP_ID=MMETSP0216-20121206/3190_1 /TAXON_ID=223996 /ORGANISM="Protocruzia adherens, Strain Boccale" /LENGTH=469 /DNA_ID=CAMNT_0002338401 /DNA_START=68 /DNA_END=1477 /DNA_ORIENTATION=-